MKSLILCCAAHPITKQELSVIYTVLTMLQPARWSYELTEICQWKGHELPKPVGVLGLIVVTSPSYSRHKIAHLWQVTNSREAAQDINTLLLHLLSNKTHCLTSRNTEFLEFPKRSPVWPYDSSTPCGKALQSSWDLPISLEIKMIIQINSCLVNTISIEKYQQESR